MGDYTISNWMVAWAPDEPESVEVGPWPDHTGWTACRPEQSLFTTGCCELARRDGIDPQAAHREFLKIDEYRRHISPDIDGAADTFIEDFLCLN